jgi:hypothetical protein
MLNMLESSIFWLLFWIVWDLTGGIRAIPSPSFDGDELGNILSSLGEQFNTQERLEEYLPFGLEGPLMPAPAGSDGIDQAHHVEDDTVDLSLIGK